MFGFGRRRDAARTAETRAVQVVGQDNIEFARVVGLADFLGGAATGLTVTTENALGVPAVWAAVNFLSGTFAGLPVHVYRRGRNGRTKLKTPLARMLSGAWNDETSSFEGRKYAMERVLTGGRSFIWVERAPSGNILNLWPLQPSAVTVRQTNGRRSYVYRLKGSDEQIFDASEIIDIAFQSKEDGVAHYGPISSCKDAIALSIAATQYGSKFFQGGGVPPFAVTGNFQTSASMQRASDDLESAIKKATKDDRQALVLPAGLEIKPIGGDPNKAQLLELKQHCVEEIARIYSLPPNFLQDLSRATFSNVEQQDLHFTKHTIKRWVEQWEQELTLKLFGRNSSNYVEFELDGLLRGDFKTRMDGYAAAIQHGTLTPNEARELENRQAVDGGDQVLVQGAMVPLSQQIAGDGGNDEV